MLDPPPKDTEGNYEAGDIHTQVAGSQKKAPEFLHGITPNDFLTVAGDVETLSVSFRRGPTQCGPFLSSVPQSSGQEAGSA
jgi:hypothetical protein